MFPVDGRFTPTQGQENKVKIQWLQWHVEALSTCITEQQYDTVDEFKILKTVRDAYKRTLDTMVQQRDYSAAQFAIGGH